jgi:hypothetical protein
MRKVVVPDGEPFVLQLRDFVLAITAETLDLGNDVLDRQSDARVEQLQPHGGCAISGDAGLFVHFPAGLDAGFGFVSRQAEQQVRRADQPAREQAGFRGAR